MIKRIKKYFKDRQRAKALAFARMVADEIGKDMGGSYQEFLAPVVLRDTVYMVTKWGRVYALRQGNSGYEEIRRLADVSG